MEKKYTQIKTETNANQFERYMRIAGDNVEEIDRAHELRIDLADCGYPFTLTDRFWYCLN